MYNLYNRVTHDFFVTTKLGTYVDFFWDESMMHVE